MRPITVALLSFGLAALTACSRIDPIGTDLVALNAAGQAAMAQADVQQRGERGQGQGARRVHDRRALRSTLRRLASVTMSWPALMNST